MQCVHHEVAADRNAHHIAAHTCTMTTVSDAEGGVAHATGGAKPEHHDNDRGRLYAANAQVGANASDDESSEAIPPFPYFYIFLLCLSLLSNALYVTSLFPYLPDLTHDMTGLPETAVVSCVMASVLVPRTAG